MAIKTIKVGDKPITLDSSAGWLVRYRNQFGEDILPAIMPIVAALVDGIASIAENMDGDTIDMNVIKKSIDDDVISNMLVKFSMLELTTVINILWAMAKNNERRNGGEEVGDPDAWVDQFDDFPIDVILPELIKILFTSFVSKKNRMKMKKVKKTAQETMNQLAHTTSSNPQSSED